MRGFYVKGITVLTITVFGFVSLGLTLDDRGEIEEVGEELAYLPSVEYLKPALLGFEHLAADLFWLQTVQYFGSHIQTDRRYPKLYQLVDLVTSLDPQFVDAFHFGGLFLTLGRQYPEAIAIYEKGIAENPSRWELPYDLGRVYYLELHDYPKALYWWELANRLPDRPHYLPRFIAR
ncbi:MAG: tetratricopeptide repeat protein, partial [Candidatus Methylomirabilales bacterium]